MKFKNYRVKVKRQRIVTNTMTVDIKAANKRNAIRRAKENFIPDTGTSKSEIRVSVDKCEAI